MARIISHPFRLGPGGAVATVEQGTDQANTEQIAVLALTRTGERPLVPGFGVTDPAFIPYRPGELVAGVATWGPSVRISSVDTVPLDDATRRVEVTFT